MQEISCKSFAIRFTPSGTPALYKGLKNNFKYGSARRIIPDFNTAIMRPDNFTDKGKSKTYTSQCPASGFVDTEERFKHPLPQFLRNPVSRIFYQKINMLFFLKRTYGNTPS